MDTMSPECCPLVTVNVEELVRFLDEKPSWSVGHATAVVGIAGEDLGAACFGHYVQSKGGTAEILKKAGTCRPRPVTTGKKKGPRLDRWIRTEWPGGSLVFQAEIKSWSAHAIGGRVLPVGATREEVKDYKQERWQRHWNPEQSRLRGPHTLKVLLRMKVPGGVDPECVRPLLILWEALAPGDQAGEHLFSVRLSDGLFEFPELWVFSVSSYLRGVLERGEKVLRLAMPDTASRLESLKRILSA